MCKYENVKMNLIHLTCKNELDSSNISTFTTFLTFPHYNPGLKDKNTGTHVLGF
jgi:hypothetical protein